MFRLLISAILVSCCMAEKVIIIGSGAAGIAAASRLLDNNITDFRILEAEDRIGGRIHSFFFGDAFVDLGAQYVHGQQNNIVYQMATDILKPGIDNEPLEIYTPGCRKDGDTLMDLLGAYVAEPYNIADEATSIGDKFLKSYNATILKKYANDIQMQNYAWDFIRMCECYILSLEGSFRWFDPSAAESFDDCPGDQTLSWDGRGYKTMFDIMLRNYPRKTGYDILKKVSLGTTVTKIVLGDKKVQLRTNKGYRYVADHVIFTPSLGVLKQEHEKLFEPALSYRKKNVIENLGMDGVMKIVMKFPNSWWGNKKYFGFVWNEEAKKNLFNEVPFGPEMDGEHWLSWFFHLGQAPKNSKVMIAWIVGPMVPKIEKMTEYQVKFGLLHAIRKFLGKDFNVTEPTEVIHSKWCTNPNFRGTYSYEPVKIKKLHLTLPHNILAEPILGRDNTPRILFAGEATSSNRFATVDGAVGTGYREADRLLAGPLKSNWIRKGK